MNVTIEPTTWFATCASRGSIALAPLSGLHIESSVTDDEDHLEDHLTVYPAAITRGLMWALPRISATGGHPARAMNSSGTDTSVSRPSTFSRILTLSAP
jgi:hypothetical protein